MAKKSAVPRPTERLALARAGQRVPSPGLLLVDLATARRRTDRYAVNLLTCLITRMLAAGKVGEA